MSSAPPRTHSSTSSERFPRPTENPNIWQRVSALFMRTQVDGWVRITAWASLLANSLLILTGGLVRLTGSGLGCPTWPQCTEDSWTSTAAMGIHGAIEFGNRLLTFGLALVAVLAFLAVLKMRDHRRDLFGLTLVLGLGIVVQAVVGGITVRTGLNPWVVGIHFMISAVMIFLATVYVNRTRRYSLPDVAIREAPGQAQNLSGVVRGSALLLALLTFAIVYLGTLVTGTGPHSGDSGEVVRHTFDAVVITRMHVIPVYAITALIALALLVGRTSWPRPVWKTYALVGCVVVFQALIGFYQYFNGLPVLVVTAHLVGSALLIATVASTVEKSFALTTAPTQPV